MTGKELNEFLKKPAFVNSELGQSISLQGIASKRYSDYILSQAYKLKPEPSDINEKEKGQ